MIQTIIFAHPSYLWLLLLLLPLVVWYVWKHRDLTASISMSTTAQFASLPRSRRGAARHLLFVLQLLAIAALIVVIARPQTVSRWRTSSTSGTEIVLVMDISGSMLAKDFEPNRFGAAKEVATRFVNGRENDALGLVIFAGESFTAVPMTTDRAMLTNYINSLDMNIILHGMLEDGTAIGDGVATAINRIKDGKAKSKSIILITDGTNNRGNVAPNTAAEIAAKYGIKIYTIGVGTKGNAPVPQQNAFGRIEYVSMPVTIDENTLKQMASMTGGKYFRATGNEVLNDVFDEIDSLEKTEIDVRNFSNTDDDYMTWGALALGFLVLSMLLRMTLLRSNP